MIYSFEWDTDKSKINLIKHDISFEDAATIFKDPNTLTVFDDSHSEDEERWITFGLSSSGKLLVVNHTFKEINSEKCIIRIFSSRKANKSETKQYGE